MTATRLKIFVSSVQKELAEDRRALKAFIEDDNLLRRFFTVFLFEDLPASDRQADAVYLEQVDRCDLYLACLGMSMDQKALMGYRPRNGNLTGLRFRGNPVLFS